MDFCDLSESPLEPHPLVHEIIRSINNGMKTHDLIHLQNRRMLIADPASSPGALPLQDDNFRGIQQNWSEQLIRYLVYSNLDFIQSRCTVPIPKEFIMTDFNRLRLFKVDHQEFREALKRLTEGALNNESERSTFIKIMPLHLDLKPDQIPWCPMTDKEWGVAPLDHLARHFGLIATDSEAPGYKSLIASFLAGSNVPAPDDMARRLNREAKRKPSFNPPVLEGLASQPELWSTALVRAVVNRKFEGPVPESYKIMPEDILQIYPPDSPEYLKGLKQYLQTYIDTGKYVSFQGMLDHLNWKVKGREFMALTPFLDGLSDNQKGVTPWTRSTLQTVINALGLKNPPQSKGSGMEEIVQEYLSVSPPLNPPVAMAIQLRLNRKTAGHTMTPVPDELKPLLIKPKISAWNLPLIRLSIALLVRKTSQLQSGLPSKLRVKKEDIDQLVKPGCRHLLTPYLQSLL